MNNLMPVDGNTNSFSDKLYLLKPCYSPVTQPVAQGRILDFIKGGEGGGPGLLGDISRLKSGGMLHHKNQTVDCEISLLDCVLAFLTPHSRVYSPSISLLLDLP